MNGNHMSEKESIAQNVNSNNEKEQRAKEQKIKKWIIP